MKSSAKNAVQLVEEYYSGGEKLRHVPLKNYTSGDGDNLGFEGLVDHLISIRLKALNIDGERYEISQDYFVGPNKETDDPQRMDHHVWIDGKCVLVVESRAWIDKPFYTLKRAVVRNFMELDYVRQRLHDDVMFAFVALAIDIKPRLVSTLDKTMGYGDRIEQFKFSPYRRNYKKGNYFDHGVNRGDVTRFINFLDNHLAQFV